MNKNKLYLKIIKILNLLVLLGALFVQNGKVFKFSRGGDFIILLVALGILLLVDLPVMFHVFAKKQQKKIEEKDKVSFVGLAFTLMGVLIYGALKTKMNWSGDSMFMAESVPIAAFVAVVMIQALVFAKIGVKNALVAGKWLGFLYIWSMSMYLVEGRLDEMFLITVVFMIAEVITIGINFLVLSFCGGGAVVAKQKSVKKVVKK